jgi:hypothetical protein
MFRVDVQRLAIKGYGFGDIAQECEVGDVAGGLRLCWISWRSAPDQAQPNGLGQLGVSPVGLRSRSDSGEVGRSQQCWRKPRLIRARLTLGAHSWLDPIDLGDRATYHQPEILIGWALPVASKAPLDPMPSR